MTKSTAFRFYTFWYLHLMLKNLITELQCLCYNGGLCLFVGLAFVFVFFLLMLWQQPRIFVHLEWLNSSQYLFTISLIALAAILIKILLFIMFDFLHFCLSQFPSYCVFLFPLFVSFFCFLISSLILVRLTFISFSGSVPSLFSTSNWFLLLFQV